MSEVSHFDPTNRFSGLANVYARSRPNYPQSAIDAILQTCGLSKQATLVDVGCGTGISARQFAPFVHQVIGIEPNADMRREAEQAPVPAGSVAPSYRLGQAEATGLPSAQADAVLAAQAFHWFDPEPTLGEFQRILKPGGWVALMWNERDETDAFTAAYGKIIRRMPDAVEAESRWRRSGEPLLKSPHFRNGKTLLFAHEQQVDEEGLIGRGLSVSFAPKEPAQLEAFAAELRDTFRDFAKEGKAFLRYQTSVLLAQRA